MMNRNFLLCAVMVVAMLTGNPSFAAHPPAGRTLATTALAFTDSLTSDQVKECSLPFDSPERVKWHYVPMERKGIALDQLNTDQRKKAFELLKASLSESGFHKAQTVFELEELIRKQESNSAMRDPLKYYFAVYGEPDEQGRWGVSIEGHHLSVNLVVDSGRIVSSTPLFLGANPANVVRAEDVGPPKGTRALATEEDLAQQLVRSMTDHQRAKAVVAGKTAMDMREAPKPQTTLQPTEGITASELTPDQQKTLFHLCEAAISNAPAEITSPEMDKIRNDQQTRFAWYGSTAPNEPFSCRVHGKDVLILLFKAQSDAIGTPANHTHLLWRTPGRDFGVTD